MNISETGFYHHLASHSIFCNYKVLSVQAFSCSVFRLQIVCSSDLNSCKVSLFFSFSRFMLIKRTLDISQFESAAVCPINYRTTHKHLLFSFTVAAMFYNEIMRCLCFSMYGSLKLPTPKYKTKLYYQLFFLRSLFFKIYLNSPWYAKKYIINLLPNLCSFRSLALFSQISAPFQCGSTLHHRSEREYPLQLFPSPIIIRI